MGGGCQLLCHQLLTHWGAIDSQVSQHSQQDSKSQS